MTLNNPSAGERPDVRLRVSAEALILAGAAFVTLGLNRPFLLTALQSRDWSHGSAWGLAAALLLMLLALNTVIIASLAVGRWAKAVLGMLLVTSALVMHYMQTYHVVIDAAIVRSTLRTHLAEAQELLSWSLAADLLLYAALPIWLLRSVTVARRPWRPALLRRAALIGSALLVLVGSMAMVFQPLSALMRNERTLRYQITPANALWSLGSVLVADARGAAQPRVPIGLDAALGPSHRSGKPRLLVLVVGETARAANWGLNGYARDTTPQLAQRGVLNFAHVTSCGTDTESSLPCMFAPIGRRNYDEARIRGSESLLHVLTRAGVSVHWRDNQSGCKGVCEGLSNDWVNTTLAPGLCQGGRCWDEGLLRGLEERIQSLHGTQVLVLHMLGNHGPSYFRRYPAAFERFKPACRQDDLGQCAQPDIVNAYDNALLYTDHVLATVIDTLRAHAHAVDVAMVYVSDHGESLGELNLFLHGMPYALAPREQTQVPMVWWMSPGYAARAGVDAACLKQQAAANVSHDNLFHSLLGLLDVHTALYEPELDITAPCREASTSSVAAQTR
jgi:lipid A ethanolaminephosphotransferase